MSEAGERHKRWGSLLAIPIAAMVCLALPLPAGAEEHPGDPHDARRAGAAFNPNSGTSHNPKFDTDGADDYRVDADVAATPR